MKRLPAASQVKLLTTAVVLALVPSLALANMGTPLMALGPAYLTCGNLFIGLVEGAILSFFLGTRLWSSLLVMILANYFSLLGVTPLLALSHLILGSPTINNADVWLVALFACSYLGTLLAEAPFALSLTRYRGLKEKRFHIVFIASQTATYAVVAAMFFMASSTSLVFGTRVDTSLRFLEGIEANLYFIDLHEGQLKRMDLSTRRASTTIREINSRAVSDRAFVWRNSAEETWRLGVLGNQTPHDLGLPDPTEAVPTPYDLSYDQNIAEFVPLAMTHQTLEDVARSPLRHAELGVTPGAEPLEWGFDAGFWAYEGMTFTRQGSTARARHYALDVPGASWAIRNATLLPDDIVIFQLGDDQIVALDLKTDTVGLLARGRGPLVTERVAASGS